MAKFNWQSKKDLEDQLLEAEKIKKEKEALEKALPAVLKAVRTLIRVDELTTEELNSIIDLYPDWVTGVKYEKDQLFQYGNQLYRVLSNHSSQSDWLPDVVPALYTPVSPPDIVGEWKQPTGAHDAYKVGDRVTFDRLVYESLIDGNTWSPTDYPQGWSLIV